jgi:hypothetical protein
MTLAQQFVHPARLHQQLTVEILVTAIREIEN